MKYLTIFLAAVFLLTSNAFAQDESSCDEYNCFNFSEDNETFVDQWYICGGGDVETGIHLEWISIYSDDVTICVVASGEHVFINKDDIIEMHLELFSSTRSLDLVNGCSFHFVVTGNTPKPLVRYFSNLYWSK